METLGLGTLVGLVLALFIIVEFFAIGHRLGKLCKTTEAILKHLDARHSIPPGVPPSIFR